MNSRAGGVVRDTLNVESVSKTYVKKPWLDFSKKKRTSHTALSGVSFTIRSGETVGLLGPNGAGKTTLLKIITTLLYPSSGRVLLDGEDVSVQSRVHRSRMGLVTCDERSFYWRLTAWQNLRFFAALTGQSGRTADRRIGELLETLGLKEAADRPYQEYSTGMRQKMAIARGLLGNPRLVLYDEPTRSLDPLSARNIRSYIKDHRRRFPEQTHLIATNQLHEAELLCDRVVIIGRGRLVALGTVDEVKRLWDGGEFEAHLVRWKGTTPADELLQPDPNRGLLACVHRPDLGSDATLTQFQIRKGSDGLSYALGTILQSGGKVLRCEPREPDFAEIFCSLVQDQQVGASSEAGVLQ